MGQFIVDAQHLVSNYAGLRNHYRENLVLLQAREVNVLEHFLRTTRHRNADLLRYLREHVRCALHESLQIIRPAKRTLNYALVDVRNTARPVSNLRDVVTISLRSRYPAGRGMRLLEVSRVGQIGHHVSDTSRA